MSANCPIIESEEGINAGSVIWFWLKGTFLFVKTGSRVCLRFIRVHNPVVVLTSIIPGFGAFAYLASRPLRRVVLIRLILDQSGRKVPFKLYSRLGIQRLVAPKKRDIHTA